jgi:hypothetical protein
MTTFVGLAELLADHALATLKSGSRNTQGDLARTRCGVHAMMTSPSLSGSVFCMCVEEEGIEL